jgi:hypothetical protein
MFTISGRVLDEKSNKPIPGISVRLKVVLSPAKDSQITAAVTDQDGKYTITTTRGTIDRYTDSTAVHYKKASLKLIAEPVQTEQPQQYKNPYKTSLKEVPHLFYNQLILATDALQKSNINQDIKMQAGAIIICHSPPVNTGVTVSLDVTGLQKPRDHIRVTVNNHRYLVVRPDHPYLANVIYQLPGMDSITADQIIKQDTIRLKPMDTFAINISPGMLRSMPIKR